MGCHTCDVLDRNVCTSFEEVSLVSFSMNKTTWQETGWPSLTFKEPEAFKEPNAVSNHMWLNTNPSPVKPWYDTTEYDWNVDCSCAEVLS